MDDPPGALPAARAAGELWRAGGLYSAERGRPTGGTRGGVSARRRCGDDCSEAGDPDGKQAAGRRVAADGGGAAAWPVDEPTDGSSSGRRQGGDGRGAAVLSSGAAGEGKGGGRGEGRCMSLQFGRRGRSKFR